MIKVENIDVYGFEHAIRAMRNPMNSWDKSDSYWDTFGRFYHIGKNDLDLMKRLYKSGPEHRTYARMICVWMDITAPLYWWKEMDRYGIGKSQVSTSTMHKIHAKEFDLNDFSYEHLILGDIDEENYPLHYDGIGTLARIVVALNEFRTMYLEMKDKKWWWQMIQLLPSSYNQKRTICMSYEVVFKIIKERTGHKLNEWNEFVEILKDLPYVKEIIEDGSET